MKEKHMSYYAEFGCFVIFGLLGLALLLLVVAFLIEILIDIFRRF